MTAAELRAALEAAGVSQTTLAARLAVSRRLVVYWLEGTRPIPDTRAEQISRALQAGPRCKRCGQLLPGRRHRHTQ